MDSRIQIGFTKSMGRGVFALQDIPAGQTLMTIDEQHIIVYKMMLQHPLFSFLADFNPQSNLHSKNRKVQFAFYMAFINLYYQQQEDNQTEHFDTIKSYIKQLPSCFNNLLCWTIEQLNNLSPNTQLIENTIKKQNIIEKYFLEIREYLRQRSGTSKNIQNKIELSQERETESSDSFGRIQQLTDLYAKCTLITVDDIFKFYSAIESRYVHYPNGMDSKSQVGALVMNLELFNHSFHGKVEKVSNTVKTIQKVLKGEQIFISYCKKEKSNAYLLERYGFLIDGEFETTKNQKFLEGVKEIEKGDKKEEGLQMTENTEKEHTHLSKVRADLALRYNKWHEEIQKYKQQPQQSDNSTEKR